MEEKKGNVYRVELSFNQLPNLHCPFCGQLICDDDGWHTEQSCEHLVFVASDEGFEYRAPRYDKAMRLEKSKKALRAFEGEDFEGYDLFTDKPASFDIIKFAFYGPMPCCGVGIYAGFAPVPDGYV